MNGMASPDWPVQYTSATHLMTYFIDFADNY